MPIDQAQTPPSTLTLPDGTSIAYHRTLGKGPGVVFLHGFRSDMSGDKALAVESWCRSEGRAMLRFDQFGHGLSSGRFEEGCIGRWASDTVAVLDALTDGPQILVGSSMGGWLAILAARARPERIAGWIGVAAAPDFTEDLIWPALSPDARLRLAQDGVTHESHGTYDTPTPLTRTLFEDGRKHLVLRAPLPFEGPVHLLHGLQDASIPWQTALRLQERLTSQAVRVTLIKDGDHRLSRPQDLDLLVRVLAMMK